jgi:hypothetical protein
MPRRKKSTIQEREPLHLPPENQKAKMWLWIGVSSVSAIILVMWGYATSISLSSFSWARTPEKKLIENSKNDWNEIFNDEKTRIRNEQLKLQMKRVISTIVAEANSSTINASTTSSATTTIATNSTTPSTSSHQ